MDIFDKSQALRTILPTGNQRCNLTNATDDIEDFIKNYPRGKKFLYSIFSRHFNYDSIEFFNKLGIATYIQKDKRIFPKSNSSKEVKDKMFEGLKKYKNYHLIHKKINSKDELKNYDRIIISTGSRNCENLIRSFNQPLIPFKKSLCALVVKDFIYPKGVKLKALNYEQDYGHESEFIFTDKGISGPLAFKISSIKSRDDFPYSIEIELFKIEKIKDLIKQNPKKSITTIVSMLIPKTIAKIITDNSTISASNVSDDELKKYSKLNLTIISSSDTGEIVNSGGVDLKYLDKNCKSKINDNLWFCGEVLDIDGFCGGFNLQNCWSTGFVVAKDVVSSIIEKEK